MNRLRALLERRPALAAFCAGLGLAASLPPVYLLPGVLGFGVLVALLWQAGPAAAFWRGTAFAYGYFLAGLYWVGIAFFADAERFGPYAVPAVLMLALILSLTVGVAAAVVALRRWRRIEAQALAFAVAWVIAEQFRGGLGLQFPWNPIASVWAITDASLQVVAYTGTYGLSLLTVAAAGLAAPLFLQGIGSRRAAVALPVLFGLLVIGAGGWRLYSAPELPDTEVRLRIVQANISQHHKWNPELRAAWFRHHLELSAQAHDPPPQVVIWPESAVPYDVEAEPEVRSLLAEVTPLGGLLLVGGDRYEFDRRPQVAHNSLFVVDGIGVLRARYDKVDLVPFGEFLPFRGVLRHLGLSKLTEGGIDFSPGPGRVTLQLPNLPPASPLICYEAAFPGEATASGARPAWLVNITNDAWFGRSSGPFQHLVMARTRAIEEGLPLVRAANTGISVVTDSYGRVRERLGIDETGVIDTALPAPLPEASFARRLGSGLLLALLLAVATASVLIEWRGGHAPVRRND